ncbi:hypothetical protein ASPCAL00901 [Aspergillus calidoustus]|uniref:Mannosyl phosphorylinositol ceramide synthase SUR1 n=1 Tax=Aspergillus calidoustus TaxID=454130 RepID=A0A0U5FPW0_ASPCI|nr:hypothetical protein ASPCAL00901 [Aspergillus calidoustus]
MRNFRAYLTLPGLGGISTRGGRTYDEEGLDWKSSLWHSRRRTFLLRSRTRKTVMLLLCGDLMVIGLLLQTIKPLISLMYHNKELFTPQTGLSGLNTSDTWGQVNQSNKIPRILHQTTATEVIPDHWVEPQRSCKNAYLDFEYKLWTDDSARNFLAVEYPWFVDIWDSYAFPIQRADAIRYFVLYHYGGIYLDMDTWCNKTIPIHALKSGPVIHHALFKPTLPTGITNAFMMATAKHPVYAAAIAKLPAFHAMTKFWARLQPYCAVMISTGPLFLTLVVKDYLLKQPSLPSPTIWVIDTTELGQYITDLESATWHHSDARIFIWLSDKPFIWFSAGVIVLVSVLYVLNYMLIMVSKHQWWKVPYPGLKLTKAT